MFIGFMTGSEVVIQAHQIIVWNFIDNTEVVYPIGQVKHPIRMIYNGMWLVYDEAKLYFYDMTDGSLVNNLALRQCSSQYISLLSDGRLGVVQRVGCRVISFMDSEVNRMIKVDLIDIDGSVTTHEIPAHQLAQFFVEQVKKDEYMTSCVLSSYGEKITFESDNERFVMIFACFGSDATLNNAATELVKTAKKGCFNVPYQGWKFDNRSITASYWKNNVVFGNAIIVREQKIDGRWQLVSIS